MTTTDKLKYLVSNEIQSVYTPIATQPCFILGKENFIGQGIVDTRFLMKETNPN